MSIVYISLLAFVLLAVIISYLIFTIIFWCVRRSISNVHRLQFQFNKFNSFNFKNLIKPLELLIRNHRELTSVVDYIHQFDVSFQTNLNQVIKALKIVSIYDNHYDLKNTRKYIKKINSVFVVLDEMIAFSVKFSTDATEYQINTSRLIIYFRRMIDGLLLFLHQHILGSYDNNILKKCVTRISDYLIQMNEQSNKLSSQKFIQVADKISGEIAYLERIVKSIYSLDLKLKYLRIVHSQIEFYANNADNFKKLNYSNTQINEIKNMIDDGKIILDKIKSNLHLFQFQTAHELNEYLFEKLVQLKKQINADASAFSVVNENIRSFDSQVDVFEKNFEITAKSLKVVEKNFMNNQQVGLLIVDVWKKMDEIKAKIDLIQNYKSNIKQHYFERLKYFIFVVDNIMECQEIMEMLVKTVTSLMESFKYNVQEVNNLKLLFAQLRVYIIKEKLFLSTNYENLFHQWEQKIDEKNDSLTKDYSKFSDNIEDFLKQAHEIFRGIMKEVAEQAEFKQIAASCIAFINKYINEHSSIYFKQREFELLFLDGKYEKIIKKSIKIISVIKESAYENNINLQ